jgi:hypothetical protein
MLDQSAKSPLQSLGVIGAAGAGLTSGLNAFGVQIVPNSKADLLITLGFAALSLYGRLRATQRLTTAAPPAPPPTTSAL